MSASSIDLIQYKWYAIKVNSYTGAVAQCMGATNDSVLMRYYDGWIWRSIHPVHTSEIGTVADDPRIIIRLAKLMGRVVLDLDFI